MKYWQNYSYFYTAFDLIHLHFSFPLILNSKYCMSFNNKDHKVKNSTTGYWDIGDSNETEFDLKNNIECWEHLTDHIVLSIV